MSLTQNNLMIFAISLLSGYFYILSRGIVDPNVNVSIDDALLWLLGIMPLAIWAFLHSGKWINQISKPMLIFGCVMWVGSLMAFVFLHYITDMSYIFFDLFTAFNYNSVLYSLASSMLITGISFIFVFSFSKLLRLILSFSELLFVSITNVFLLYSFLYFLGI